MKIVITCVCGCGRKIRTIQVAPVKCKVFPSESYKFNNREPTAHQHQGYDLNPKDCIASALRRWKNCRKLLSLHHCKLFFRLETDYPHPLHMAEVI